MRGARRHEALEAAVAFPQVAPFAIEGEHGERGGGESVRKPAHGLGYVFASEGERQFRDPRIMPDDERDARIGWRRADRAQQGRGIGEIEAWLHAHMRRAHERGQEALHGFAGAPGVGDERDVGGDGVVAHPCAGCGGVRPATVGQRASAIARGIVAMGLGVAEQDESTHAGKIGRAGAAVSVCAPCARRLVLRARLRQKTLRIASWRGRMPIFSFACRACGKEFQTLVRSSDTPECPTCQSVDLEQQLSLIASPNKGGDVSEPAPACGPAGCGACPAFN